MRYDRLRSCAGMGCGACYAMNDSFEDVDILTHVLTGDWIRQC